MLKPRPMNGRWKELRAQAAAKAAPVKAIVEAVESADVMTATDEAGSMDPVEAGASNDATDKPEEKSWFKKLTA
jgi:hypothetical protein